MCLSSRNMGEAETVPSDDKQAETGICTAEDSIVWSQEVEVCLFHAMLGHKPVGVNRHFHMICIRDKFSQNIGRQVSSKVIWDHLSTMYDMQALHESEILPFPNSEKSFVLPEEIIQDVKEGKVGSEDEVKEEFKEERDPPATHEEGLGPSMAGQDFARYGQKKTFRSVPKLQLELSTDQLITRGLCRQPSETSDHQFLGEDVGEVGQWARERERTGREGGLR
ncbi:MRG/MORF4L-binding protein-like isoform X2 [Carassius carassius]|uniref:MRG/MORF4L-binding protein-like isoform X2 n=1 Tax=Carassius carassius TaxID=217509 RepID=UPI0028689252|nr:MRG/MORF4L-binding protein-like isoform X2 [Carassius carassius]